MKNIFIFILISLFFLSCKEKTKDTRIVSVSILPQKYFVERIAGDYLKVNVMVPPGMSPATCDLTAENLEKLNNSHIYFAIGHLPFELQQLYPVLKTMDHIKVVNHSKDLKLLEGTCTCNHNHSHNHHHAGIDPHIWGSPKYVRHISMEILNTLIQYYPDQEEVFRKNYQLFLEDIAKIDGELKKVLENKKNRTFLIYHPNLSYLAADYDLNQISIEHEGKEPGPQHLKNIIDQVRQENIGIIFIQRQFDIKNAEFIARETGCKVVEINPLSDNWLEEMERMVSIFDQYFI